MADAHNARVLRRPSHAIIDSVAEPPSIIFEVPKVRWPTEGTLTLVRDLGVHEGSTFTLTDRAGEETVYRVTHVDVPDDDDPDPRWTVSVVEWQQDTDGDSPAVRPDH